MSRNALLQTLSATEEAWIGRIPIFSNVLASVNIDVSCEVARVERISRGVPPEEPN